MKINPDLLKNAERIDPFSDMPPGTKEECKLAAQLAAAIYKYRKDYNMTQKALGKFLGRMSQSQVSKLENGDCNLTIATMNAILDKLSYTISISPTGQKSTGVTSSQSYIVYFSKSPINSNFVAVCG